MNPTNIYSYLAMFVGMSDAKIPLHSLARSKCDFHDTSTELPVKNHRASSVVNYACGTRGTTH